jgi:hypothetical protein
MFCPRCKAEYRTGFTRCNDCDVALVDHLIVAVPNDDVKPQDVAYSAVRTVYDQFEADQLWSFLQGNGIPARVVGERFRYPYLVPPREEFHIIVPHDLVAKATDLLSKADGGELEIEAD